MSMITLVGNLTGDPELRFTQSGKAVVNFTVAVNRGKDDAKATDFYRVSAWESLAEHLAQLVKGTRVIVSGRMQSREYETRDGEKRTGWEVVAQSAGPELSWATATVTRETTAAARNGANGAVSGDVWPDTSSSVSTSQTGAQPNWDSNDGVPF